MIKRERYFGRMIEKEEEGKKKKGWGKKNKGWGKIIDKIL